MLARVLSRRSSLAWMHSKRTSFRSLSSNSSNITSIRLYRILLRMVQTKLNDSFPLQEPLTPSQYGSASLVSQTDHHSNENNSLNIYKLVCKWHDETPFLKNWYSVVADVPYDDNDNEESQESFSLWASKSELKTAIRHAFRCSSTFVTNNNKNNNNDRDDTSTILSLQRLAMDAIYYISQQHDMQRKSSVSIDLERGVRVVATSQCIGTTSIGGINQTIKYRFAYRIRVENLITSSQTIQLLGRTWNIQDVSPATGTAIGEAQHVHAPNNGAVGHLPVLQPGQVFEYMSGCDLFTKHGTMSGSFHMAVVDPSTRSAVVGDPIDVFGEQHPKVFEMPVEEFALEADNYNDSHE